MIGTSAALQDVKHVWFEEDHSSAHREKKSRVCMLIVVGRPHIVVKLLYFGHSVHPAQHIKP